MRTRVIGKASLAAVALSGALAGLVAGVADAKPMEREDQRYCAKIVRDYETTGRIYRDYHNRYGPNDALTIQASSNYYRAANAFASSPCR
ncbi:hypothetical protein MycrhN_1593 [Mycolicibacterium rhodesiae NBB3]|jgi:hypothetical protein|uniref:DUF732 domain-containing protein n=1 Tax=Mycolicibacterium rhodesiae (strain NBB3) TaxID=710685 RepID=G8RJ21_MYCRN|nr:hypothetical protein [Mycolicibacterium rhodesiae]AEV72209.1 hypothetical protein MycrhN_1593 [Mycolicibacterium rhodesiae NBB3]